MKNKVAVISAVIENLASVGALNRLFSDYRNVIVGRLGLPYRERKINIVTVVVDAPEQIITELAEKIGALDGASASYACSKEK